MRPAPDKQQIITARGGSASSRHITIRTAGAFLHTLQSPSEPSSDEHGERQGSDARTSPFQHSAGALDNGSYTYLPTHSTDEQAVNISGAASWKTSTQSVPHYELGALTGLKHNFSQTDAGAGAWTKSNARSACRNDTIMTTVKRLSGLQDQHLWLRLLQEKDTDDGTRIFMELGSAGAKMSVSLLQILLDQEHLSPALLGQIISHIKNKHAQTLIKGIKLAKLLRRLTHHARQVSPASLESVTDIFLDHLPPDNDRGLHIGLNRELALRRRTKMLNLAMNLLAAPPPLRPFKSSTMQEALLFRLLQYMADHSPPLHVDRQGYRALVRVQLRLPKTEAEQHWASLKALSWPPWKQDRHAVDSKLGPEYGISKARNTQLNQIAAGYGRDHWDDTASVYSGWDPEGTPSIQVRHDLHTNDSRGRTWSALWAARITSTRTIQESWMIYLEYRDVNTGRPHDKVIIAILRRLHQEEERTKTGLELQSLPGDEEGIFRPPASVHLHTYTRSKPPSTHEFFHMVLEDLDDGHWHMSPSLAASFVASAHSFQHVAALLESMGPFYTPIANIMTTNEIDNGFSLQHVPVIAAAVTTLCRFVGTPNRDSRSLHNSGLQDMWQFGTRPYDANSRFELWRSHNLVRAVWLTRNLPLKWQASSWQKILELLANSQDNVRLQHLSRSIGAMVKDGGREFKELKKHERVRFRYDVLTMQAYYLMLQVQRLIRQRLPLDVNMHFEIVKITAQCAWTASSVCNVLAESERREELLRVYTLSGLLQSVKLFLGSRPADALMESLKAAAGLSRRPLLVDDDESAGLASFESWLDDGAVSLTSDTETPVGNNGMPAADESLTPTIKFNMSLSPSHFHHWIRALGLLADHTAMIELLRQVCARDSIDIIYDAEVDSGGRLLRAAIVAVRVFLERAYVDEQLLGRLRRESTDSPMALTTKMHLKLCEPGTQEQIDEAKALLRQRFGQNMGSWATDEEFERYCLDGHLGRVRDTTFV